MTTERDPDLRTASNRSPGQPIGRAARAAGGALLIAGVLGSGPTASAPATTGEPMAAPSSPAPLTLQEAITIALSENRTLLAARMKNRIAREEIEVARERPNPELSLEATRETPNYALGLALPIETAGKRRRRIGVAESGASATEAETAAFAAEIRNRVRRSFYALSAAQRRTKETESMLDLARRAAEAAQTRFDAGDAPRLEVLQSHLAADQAENESALARAEESAARSDLAVLLARPPDAPLRAGGEIGEGALPAPDSALALALAANAGLAALDRRIAEQEARVSLARAQQYPDPVVGGAVTYRSPPEFTWGWRASLGVTLPLFTHHHAEVIVEQFALDQLRAEREAAAARIGGEVASALAHASAQRDQFERYRDRILPEAIEVETMAEDSYKSGQTGLVALLSALGAAREIRTKAIQAGLDYEAAIADLEQAMGAPLP